LGDYYIKLIKYNINRLIIYKKTMKLIREDLVKALLEYLMSRPYREVAGAVQELSQLKSVDDTPKQEIKK